MIIYVAGEENVLKNLFKAWTLLRRKKEERALQVIYACTYAQLRAFVAMLVEVPEHQS